MAVIDSYRLARSQRTPKPRKSYVKALASWLGERLPGWNQVRTGILQVSGLGCVDFAAYRFNVTLGILAIGVSLFILEALGGE